MTIVIGAFLILFGAIFYSSHVSLLVLIFTCCIIGFELTFYATMAKGENTGNMADKTANKTVTVNKMMNPKCKSDETPCAGVHSAQACSRLISLLPTFTFSHNI